MWQRRIESFNQEKNRVSRELFCQRAFSVVWTLSSILSHFPILMTQQPLHPKSSGQWKQYVLCVMGEVRKCSLATLERQSVFCFLIAKLRGYVKRRPNKECPTKRHGHCSTLSVGLRVCWLYPQQKNKSPPKKGAQAVIVNCGEASILELWGVWSHLLIAFTPRWTLTRSGRVC